MPGIADADTAGGAARRPTAYHWGVLVLDAVILMGGRAERLGGGVKGDLRVGGRTLLERVVDAAASAAAREIVVVGEAGRSVLPPEVRVVREEPPFSGPAAAIAAGLRALGSDAEAVLLLAGDQPFAAEAIPVLLAALPLPLASEGDSRDGTPNIPGSVAETDFSRGAALDGVRAIDADGRAQHLLCLVRLPALAAAVDALAAAGPLEGASMRQLLAPLKLADIRVPVGATMDVDTWADAHAIGATGGAGP